MIVITPAQAPGHTGLALRFVSIPSSKSTRTQDLSQQQPQSHRAPLVPTKPQHDTCARPSSNNTRKACKWHRCQTQHAPSRPHQYRSIILSPATQLNHHSGTVRIHVAL
ncbi:hypothetical protein VTO73DRAFT_13498 [Trametes versicolor]